MSVGRYMLDLKIFQKELLLQVAGAPDLAALDAVRVHALGKKGVITEQMKSLGAMDAEARRAAGAAINALKDEITAVLDARKAELARAELTLRLATEQIDVTLPPRAIADGRVHPISQTIEEIIQIFAQMGFVLADGPDIDDDFHNFGALNFPPDHPARDMHDTFYLPNSGDKKMLLRTHTSTVQVRTMQNQKPPIRIISVGRTYRSDAIDMTHAPMFHQCEGLVIEKNIHMGHLKGCLQDFLRAYFGVDDLPIRMRPSFFPFVEPGAEVDMGCSRKGGKLQIGNFGDWVELLGCGMVHPNVLSACGIDPNEYQGFAFGMGVERIAMLKYGVTDLRGFYEGDARWLKHYGFGVHDIPNIAVGA
jgi:phenylalanyl-tRNA synthetase alpha chain